MRVKILIIVALALGLTAGGALAKGGPPPKDNPPGQSGDPHGNGNGNQGNGNNGNQGGGKPDDPGAQGQGKDNATGQQGPTKAEANKAAAAAKKESKFQKQTKALGYTCKPGTTHVEGTVVSVVPATATTPGTLTIVVTKGNSRGKTLVGQTITITLLSSTDVIKTGHTTQAALAVGAKVKLDLRVCTAADTDATDGVTPAAGFVARKIVSNK